MTSAITKVSISWSWSFSTAKRWRRVCADGPLPIADAVRIAIQIAEALAAAHAEGIVHRDLKPANVMLVNGRPVRETQPEAKLLDFGLAVVHAAPLSEGAGIPAACAGSITRGVIAGTPQYMAPEQVRGEEADPRTDIFAFGSVLYEMLAGHPPFAGRTADEIMSAVLDADPPELSSRRPQSWLPTREYAAGARQGHRRCIEKEPDRRFNTIDEVKLELQRDRYRSVATERRRSIVVRGSCSPASCHSWQSPLASSRG